MTETSLTPAGHLPDVLETISQLPNDDVYTPPKVVAAMLDVLPVHVWSQPDYRWLDPATKSGVYLREAFKRLMVGLSDWEPNGFKRREHILKCMLFGAATTKINSEIARRTLYQTKNATGAEVTDPALADFVVHFEMPDGNIPYVETQHSLDPKGQFCTICRAPAKLDRDRRESFAYSFIHGTYPTKELRDMKFDVIVGNPPYQIGMDDGMGNRTANITPLYNLFVEKAISMNPKYLVMITPSRWFTSGHGLSDYRTRMMNDRRLRVLVDNPKLYDVFPQAEIKGGVSYFLWDRDYDGDCEFSTRIDGVVRDVAKRDLRQGVDVVLRDNFAARVVAKIVSDSFSKGSLGDLVSPSDPFGASIKTNFKRSQDEPFEGSIPLIFVNKVGYIRREQLERNENWVDRWKVLIPKAGDGHGREPAYVLGEPLALAPGSACTQSYLVAGTFNTEQETENFAKFLTTKFCRFLVLQRKISQDLTPSRFGFVPILNMSQRWTDVDLYERFNLTSEEIAYIERVIAPREPILSLNSAIPATHLPGGRKYRPGDALVEADDEDGDEE
jgi:site-specific DNA-methyltransferase (adenine-specific)